jgi:hypothetical protein
VLLAEGSVKRGNEKDSAEALKRGCVPGAYDVVNPFADPDVHGVNSTAPRLEA